MKQFTTELELFKSTTLFLIDSSQIRAMHFETYHIIANFSRCISFVVMELDCKSLETFIVPWLHGGSVVWPYKLLYWNFE